jgi:hypothetical protein
VQPSNNAGFRRIGVEPLELGSKRFDGQSDASAERWLGSGVHSAVDSAHPGSFDPHFEQSPDAFQRRFPTSTAHVTDDGEKERKDDEQERG